MAESIDGVNYDEHVPELIKSGAYRLCIYHSYCPEYGTEGLWIIARPKEGDLPSFGLCLEGGWHIVERGAPFPDFYTDEIGGAVSSIVAGFKLRA